MSKYDKHIASFLIKPIANFVNSMDGEQRPKKQREPMTKDRFLYEAFGGSAYKHLSDEGQEKYWLDHFNRINPPRNLMAERQELLKDPKAYLDKHIEEYLNKSIDINEDKDNDIL